MRTFVLAMFLGGTACSAGSTPVRPATNESLLGTWAIEFDVDSMRRRDSVHLWARPAVAPVRGILRISDTVVRHNERRSAMSVSFVPLLGHEMSCYSPGAGTVAIGRDGTSWRVWFTPGAGDCGFGAEVQDAGDTLHGTWSEQSYTGSAAEGRLKMIRQR